MLNVKIIVGSTREGRFSEKILPWINAELDKTEGISYEVLDLRDWEMPFYASAQSPKNVTDGQYENETITKFAAKVAEADAYILITPEYNHGTSAVLKNALDVIYNEWNQKPVAFVSYGSIGGGRAVEQLRQVVVELQMASVRNAVHIMNPWFMLDEKGNLKDGALDDYTKSLSGTLEQLQWWGNALKEARSK